MSDYRDFYRNKPVMITGGLGFIGSNLARHLVELGAEEIQVFGDGSQIRDFVYVDDAAEAFLRAGATNRVNGLALNVGGHEHLTHKELVETLLRVAGTGRVRYVEWPEEKRKIDIGSFYSDSTRFRAATGWHSDVDIREGLAKTMALYRAHREHYVDEEETAA